jgi:hypothetical protein
VEKGVAVEKKRRTGAFIPGEKRSAGKPPVEITSLWNSRATRKFFASP